MRELFPSLTAGIAAFNRGLWRVTKWVGRALLYLLPILILAHLFATVVTGRLLQRDMARLKTAGILLPAKDLIPSVPPGEPNAATFYEQAWKTLRLSNEDKSALFDKWAKHDANWLELARQVVASNSDYYRLLNQATEIHYCVFPVDWSVPLEVSFTHFNQLREATRMLSLHANVAAADGQIQTSFDSLASMVRVAQHAKTDPVLISELVSYAIQGITVSTLEKVLTHGNPSNTALKNLYEEVGKINNNASSIYVMKGELSLFGIRFFNIVRSGKASINDLSGQPSRNTDIKQSLTIMEKLRGWPGRPLFNTDQRVYLAVIEQQIKAVELPWPESDRIMREHESWLVQSTPKYAIITRMVSPVFSRFVWSRDRATASIRAAQIALALKAYQVEQGAFPANLSMLEESGWKLPRDPFGEKEFHYRREGKGFVVWSIGPDMQDDKAARAYEDLTIDEQRKPNASYDIIFRCLL